MTDYLVRLFRTDGGGTLTTPITSTKCYVGADGGTYEIGKSKDAADLNSILSTLGNAALVQTNVLPSGRIVLKQGDDHTIAAGNEITITQSDVGSVLHDRLQAATSLSIGFRFCGDSGTPSDIEGTIDKTNATHAGDVTTIKAEVLVTAMASATPGDYEYDVQRELAGGVKDTELTGPTVMQKDNAA